MSSRLARPKARSPYIVNLQPGSQITGRNAPTTPPKFQLSATRGGAPLTWSTDTASVNLTYLPQALATVFGRDRRRGLLIVVSISARLGQLRSAKRLVHHDGPAGWQHGPARPRSATARSRSPAPMDNNANYYSAFDMATTA